MSEHSPLRRSIDALLPFLVGLVIGVLTSYSSLSGRIAALETTTATHSKELDGVATKLDEINAELITISSRLGTARDGARGGQ